MNSIRGSRNRWLGIRTFCCSGIVREAEARCRESWGKKGIAKELWHMVIVKSLWRALQEHTVAPEAMPHRLLRRMVAHLQERIVCRDTQLEVRAENMRDPVTKWVEMASIRYNPNITEMEVRKQPNWRPRRSEGETEVEKREGEVQRERLMARRRRRPRQI